MAYTAPTVDSFVERFPEFDGQDAAVEFALAEAALQVGDAWPEADRAIALMLLAAHLVQDGANAASGRDIASESIGPFSVSYFRADSTWMAGTTYGQRYRSLLRRNFPAILVI